MRTHTRFYVAAILALATLTSACGPQITTVEKTVYVCQDGTKLDTDSCPPSNPLVEQVTVTEYVCADGTTKASAEDCPPVEPTIITETVVETVTERIYVCADGSEADTAEECPEVPPEIVTETVTIYVCQNGQRLSTDDCPDIAPVVEVVTETVTRYVCALNGAVVEDPTTCPRWILTCPQGMTPYGNSVTGETGCLFTNTLHFTLSQPPVGGTYVKGSQNVDMLGVRMEALSVSARVMQMTFAINGPAPSTAISHCVLVSATHGQVVAGPESVRADNTVLFRDQFDTTEAVPMKLILRCSFANIAPQTESGDRYFATLTSVSARTLTDGNTLNTAGLPVNNMGTVAVTIVNQGAVTPRLAGDSPSSSIVLGGTTVSVAKYRIDATTETQRVRRVDIGVAGASEHLVVLQLQSGSMTKTAVAINGVASFYDTDILVPRDDYAFLTITATIGEVTAQNNASGRWFQISLTSLETVGMTSGTTQTLQMNIPAAQMVIRKTKPTVSLASGSPSGAAIPGFAEVLRFNVSADNRGYVGVRSFTFTVSATDGTGNGWVNGIQYHLYDASDLSTPVATATGTPMDRRVLMTTEAGHEIGASTTRTYVLMADTTGASMSNDDAIRVDVTDIGWSDAGLANADGSLIRNLPVHGDTIIY